MCDIIIYENTRALLELMPRMRKCRLTFDANIALYVGIVHVQHTRNQNDFNVRRSILEQRSYDIR